MKRKIKGFTLAEVLITLTITGIVASLTIPSLIANIGNQQNKMAWKKAYADFSQATMRLAVDNGGSLRGIFSDDNVMRDKYASYLNYTMSCTSGQSFNRCWHSQFKYLNGSTDNYGDRAALVLSNGSLMYFRQRSADCSDTYYGISVCGYVMFDINGFNGPNTVGKDLFTAYILESSVKPVGVQGDTFSNNLTDCTSSGSGRTCSTLYLYQ